ncbi:unnamed protein product [Prorocentrum cordatum]|uniref:Pyruvate kinase n=1 Tax=Prorocentrum cordatum TaxID=2364126 RepID=A0ABN9TYZ3_9DINO|nr:unnamed protein product [Polarella glacialis]
MYAREDVNVAKLLQRLPKATQEQVAADSFLDECWAIFKRYDARGAEKLEGAPLWRALLDALPGAFSQGILSNQYGWSLQQDAVFAFTGCGRDGEAAVSLVKFPEFVKFTLALLLHKYATTARVLAARPGDRPPPEEDEDRRQPRARLVERGDDPQDDRGWHRHFPPELLTPPRRRLREGLPPHPQVFQDDGPQGGGARRPPGPEVPRRRAGGRPGAARRGGRARVRHLQDGLRQHQARAHHPEAHRGAEGAGACLRARHRPAHRGRPDEGDLRGEAVRHGAQGEGGPRGQAQGPQGRECARRGDRLRRPHREGCRGRRVPPGPGPARGVHLRLLRAEGPGPAGAHRHHGPPEGAAREEAEDLPQDREAAGSDQIDGIIEKSQALMVARGDLGVEMELERVPFAQKLLIAKAKRAGLFVINATQVVESMIESPVPTRAEVCDVQTAIFDGADAVMLSGEAASGKFPCEAVRAEADAALEAETVRDLMRPQIPDGAHPHEANKPRELDDSRRKTKVVASLGPSSWSEEMIPRMIQAGTDIFRLNCSHRRGGDFERVYPLIRKYAKELGKPVEVLGDLQGPKFRVAELAGDPVLLEKGEIFEFGLCKDDSDSIRPGRITMKPTLEQRALLKACKPGVSLLIEDGIMEVKVVEKCSESELKVEVVRGGKLKARKGVNVPDCEIDCAALTEKDIEDAEFLLRLDPPCEYICVSFAQKGQDLQELIDIMDRLQIPKEKRPKICPKIEKPQAFTNIEGIIEKSQALMVARGDLGVELGLNRVPFAQKLLIQRAKQAGLFVITATQMVESMIEQPVPTRAEVSDLCNAVWDGTDAVMLSGEAASGKFPIEAVMTEASCTLEAESVKHRVKQACPYVAPNGAGTVKPPRPLNCTMGLKRQETDQSKRKTKVVASLGPASWSEEMIPKMMLAGTDIFRLNCSHRRGGRISKGCTRLSASTQRSSASAWRCWATCRAPSSASASSRATR